MSTEMDRMPDFIELVDELIRTAHKLGEEEVGYFYNHEIKQDKEYLQKLRVETIDFWRDESVEYKKRIKEYIRKNYNIEVII